MQTTVPGFTRRHASSFATALLVLSGAAAIGTVLADRAGASAVRILDEPLTTAAELLCLGVVGAVLIARRPDLPFGWILALGAAADIVLVGVGIPSLALLDAGRGGQLAAWGACLGVLQWVPAALEGLINVRFPTGRASSSFEHWLDRALVYGIPAVLLGTFLGDSVIRDLRDKGQPISAHRFVDGTWVSSIGDACVALVPVLILLAILAGVGILVRCYKATGIERKQLEWRAAGVVSSLLLFPLSVSGLLSTSIDPAGPLIFVSTLLIPVLRYQLWAGDPVPRRRRLGPLVSRRTLIEAQEEERRRLRRDLHDGLGPLLTGLRLNLDAVQAQLATDPDKALEHLATARQASAEVISDLRGLVYGLRPPALDELGLAGALRLDVQRLAAGSGLEVTLETAIEGLNLPAAVEVALYRAVSEAVSNVARHGTAQQCRVGVTADGPDVVLTVDDDGHVIETWHPGVGLTAMRERAVELGGDFLASSGPSGFHVRMTLPRK